MLKMESLPSAKEPRPAKLLSTLAVPGPPRFYCRWRCCCSYSRTLIVEIAKTRHLCIDDEEVGGGELSHALPSRKHFISSRSYSPPYALVVFLALVV